MSPPLGIKKKITKWNKPKGGLKEKGGNKDSIVSSHQAGENTNLSSRLSMKCNVTQRYTNFFKKEGGYPHNPLWVTIQWCPPRQNPEYTTGLWYSLKLIWLSFEGLHIWTPIPYLPQFTFQLVAHFHPRAKIGVRGYEILGSGVLVMMSKAKVNFSKFSTI